MSESDQDFSLVNNANYFQSIRHSGYKSIAKALAELIDNSIEAGANEVRIIVEDASPDIDSRKRKTRIKRLFIVDNGHGMTAMKLRQGLRIGGSERYGNRSGLGRFGMGLKNASFSQCKHLEVHTWCGEHRPGTWSYLDINEIRVVPR